MVCVPGGSPGNTAYCIAEETYYECIVLTPEDGYIKDCKESEDLNNS
jgi:hypothetical protein